jgi:hypothetical protein
VADSHPTRLFDSWTEVDSDYQFVEVAMRDLNFNSEFQDLCLSDQAAALALALCMKRAITACSAIGQA